MAQDPHFRRHLLNEAWEDDALQRLVQFAFALCACDDVALQQSLPGSVGAQPRPEGTYTTVFAYLTFNVLPGEQFHNSYTYAHNFVLILDCMLNRLHDFPTTINNLQKYGQDAAKAGLEANEFRDLMLLVAKLYSADFYGPEEMVDHWKTWENFVRLSGVELHKDCYRDLYVPYMKMVSESWLWLVTCRLTNCSACPGGCWVGIS